RRLHHVACRRRRKTMAEEHDQIERITRYPALASGQCVCALSRWSAASLDATDSCAEEARSSFRLGVRTLLQLTSMNRLRLARAFGQLRWLRRGARERLIRLVV